MIIKIQDIWATSALNHRRFLSRIINKSVIKLENMQGPALDIENKVLQLLIEHRNTLLGHTPNGLETVISSYENDFPTDSEKKKANALFDIIFDYDKFSIKNNWNIRLWSAYKLCNSVKYNFCPYCQTAPIDTKIPEYNNAGSYRPNIDHFYSKARYPFLSLTLGNFIPSCERCNGNQMKGDKNFYMVPHLNPLSDAQSIKFNFSLRPELANDFLGTLYASDSEHNYEITLIPAQQNHAKALHSLQTFQLTDRYQIYRGAVFRMRRQILNCQTRLRMIANALPLLNAEISDIVGFDITNDEYKNAPTGKLKFDIYTDLIANL